MDQPLTLQDLGGAPPGARPRSRVLRHYQLVEGARARGWTWGEIGSVLGLSGDAARRAYLRVQRAVEAGKIDRDALARAEKPPPRKGQGPTRPSPQAQRQEPGGLNEWKTLSGPRD